MARFIKGETGNAGGRPREVMAVREMARQRTEKAILTLEAIMDDVGVPPAARVAAANAILDRAVGKPNTILEAVPPSNQLLDVVEAARRIAFAINTAAIQGIELEGIFKELVPPAKQLAPPALRAPDAEPSTS